MRDTPHRIITELEDRPRRANEVIASSSPSYTLKEIEALAREHLDSFYTDDDRVTAQLVMSHFRAWLARREREGRSNVEV